MASQKNFLANTGFVSIAKILEQIMAYVIIVLISRNLGAKGLGEYSFIFAFASFFFIFSDWGLSFLMTKDLSCNFSNVQTYVSNILAFKLLLSLISFIIYGITIFFIGKNHLINILLLVGLINILSVLRDIPFAIFRVKTKGLIIALTNLLEKILILIGGFAVLTSRKSLLLFIFVIFISKIIYVFVINFLARGYYKLKFSFNKKFLFGLLKKSYPFLFIGIFSIVYVQMDSVMLSFMNGDEVVGWYNAGYKLINVLNVFPILLLTFGFPELSRLFAKNKKKLRYFFENILKYCLIIIIPVIVGVFLIGEKILDIIYGFNSVESVIAFKILIIAELFIYLTIVMGHLISSANKQLIFAKIAGLGAIFNLALNFILIPWLSLYGAALATLLTYMIMFIVMHIFIRRNLLTFSLGKLFLVPIFLSLIMGITIFLLRDLNLFILVIVAIVIYFIPLFIIEFKSIKKFFIKKVR